MALGGNIVFAANDEKVNDSGKDLANTIDETDDDGS